MNPPTDAERLQRFHQGRELEKQHRLHDAAVRYCMAGTWVEAARVLNHLGRFLEAGWALLLEIPSGSRPAALPHELRQRALDAATCFARAGARLEAVSLLQALGEGGKAANLLVRAGLRDEAVAAMRGEPIPGSPWPRGTIGPLLTPGDLLARVQAPPPSLDDSDDESSDERAGVTSGWHPPLARTETRRPDPPSRAALSRVDAPPPPPSRAAPTLRVSAPRPEPARADEPLARRIHPGPSRAPLTGTDVLSASGGDYPPRPDLRAVPPPGAPERPAPRVVVDLGARSTARTQDVPELPSRSDDDGIGPGTLVRDRYRIVRRIGAGGMATVYEATDEELGEAVALKLFRVIVDDPQRLRRFRREMKINRRLHHPNIVQTLEYGTWRGARFITMELLQGLDFAEFVRKEKPDDGRTIRLMMQACDGLGAAHKEGVVHRDVKPANFFVSEGGTKLKVMDFGIAKAVDSSTISVTGVRMGTPRYMAPEQIQGSQPIEPAADLYSLGCVLFEALLGRPVFETTDLMPLLLNHLSEEPPRPRSIRPDLPMELEDLLLRLLAKNPRERLVDAAAVKSALLRAYVALERLR